jgi:hypothetical protein
MGKTVSGQAIALTDGERKVLVALFRSSAGNDHDFGFIEDARSAVGSPAQLSGYVSQLAQKGLIRVGPTENAGSGPCTQFTWKKSVEAVRSIIDKTEDPS